MMPLKAGLTLTQASITPMGLMMLPNGNIALENDSMP
jgi:hypothetical protein